MPEPRLGEPGRHLVQGDGGFDRLCPRPSGFISQERHRADLAGTMADLALVLQNGQHVPIKRDWRAGRERGGAPKETGDQTAHAQTCISFVVEARNISQTILQNEGRPESAHLNHEIQRSAICKRGIGSVSGPCHRGTKAHGRETPCRTGVRQVGPWQRLCACADTNLQATRPPRLFLPPPCKSGTAHSISLIQRQNVATHPPATS